MKAGAASTPPVDASIMINAFCNACLVGNLFFSLLKMTTEFEGFSRYSIAAISALFLQMTSSILSSFANAYSSALAPYLDIVQALIHMVAVYIIIYMLTLRAECLSNYKYSKYANFGLAAFHLFMRTTLTGLNVTIDLAQINGQPNPVSSVVQQIFRMGMNVSACIVILYFETFITYTLRNSVILTGENSVAKRLHYYSLALSIVITVIFVAQVFCQAERLVDPNFIAPFQSVSWSLVLIRIVSFWYRGCHVWFYVASVTLSKKFKVTSKPRDHEDNIDRAPTF
ncbi:hypothetical protein HDV01_007633 [Terramyces sp. JEL0728]|nr:hypothetical protein HDV01_007633 [Terramyces sp. JEL0728]